MFVHSFSNATINPAQNTSLLGNKGANLIEMRQIGIPVPDGFTITTELCAKYLSEDNKIPDTVTAEIKEAIKRIEQNTGLIFGSAQRPLLFSVRSGSKASMPGMMDTVLNLGINDDIMEGIGKFYQNERFALDTYRRFLQMYGNVVLDIPSHLFEDLLEEQRNKSRVTEDAELSIKNLQTIVSGFKDIARNANKTIPTDVYAQLDGAIRAVFDSWNNPRAIKYRAIHNIPNDIYTAVNVQMMVYGNINNNSATGVVFSRNPSSGKKEIFGEYLRNAQGEDVVAGIRNTNPICAQLDKKTQSSMEETMPDAYNELMALTMKLEKHYRDMQDIEFTVQEGKLYILQTRSGKRAISAAINIAVDMVKEGMISKAEAVSRIPLDKLESVLHPVPDPNAERHVLCVGLAASPGAASGLVVFDVADMTRKNTPYILARHETSPEDIEGMDIAKGVLTAKGGITSHAAVVARGMGKPCVCGASSIIIDYKNKCFIVGNKVKVKMGDYITIDGSTGEVMLGRIDTVKPELPESFFTIIEWAQEIGEVKVYANADNPSDASLAISMQADGIGLCRTEHMFFASDRINQLRKTIIDQNTERQQDSLQQLRQMQKTDFYQMFCIMGNKPINIRLLDPPLHEFMPKDRATIEALATTCHTNAAEIELAIHRIQETNPMLGVRGCRMGISSPQIYKMQISAIFEAAFEAQRNNIETNLGIMIPLISSEQEVVIIKRMIMSIYEQISSQYKASTKYRIGVMIELPRAALQAREIAKHVDFFSFGTNDLTQTTFGISRDDTASLIEQYITQGIFAQDPFRVLDEDGVGALIEIAVSKGLTANPGLDIGLCGEHGGNHSISKFLYTQGIRYTSCSPYRIPIMILSNAQYKIGATQEH